MIWRSREKAKWKCKLLLKIPNCIPFPKGMAESRDNFSPYKNSCGNLEVFVETLRERIKS
jgi:hypothetical protein